MRNTKLQLQIVDINLIWTIRFHLQLIRKFSSNFSLMHFFSNSCFSPSSNTGKQKESKAPNPPPPVSRNKEPSKPPKPSKQGTTESPVKPTLASKPTNNGPQLLSPTKRKPSTVRAEAMPKQKVLFAPPSLPKSLPFAKVPSSRSNPFACPFSNFLI